LNLLEIGLIHDNAPAAAVLRETKIHSVFST